MKILTEAEMEAEYDAQATEIMKLTIEEMVRDTLITQWEAYRSQPSQLTLGEFASTVSNILYATLCLMDIPVETVTSTTFGSKLSQLIDEVSGIAQRRADAEIGDEILESPINIRPIIRSFNDLEN